MTVIVGQAIGRVWDWPGDPGRSHIHMGYQGGDPLFLLEATAVLEDKTRWVERQNRPA